MNSRLKHWFGRIGGTAAVLSLAAVGLIVSADQANALGSATKYRSGCTYLIQSYLTGGIGYANNTRTAGSCTGRQSVAGTYGDGSWGRVYGNAVFAQYVRSDGLLSGGRHWSCDACSVWIT